MTPMVVREVSQFDGLSILEFEQPAGLQVPRHSHDVTTLFCALEGEALDRIGSGEFPMSGGSILFRPAGAEHTHEYSSRVHALAVSIRPDMSEALAAPRWPATSVAWPLVRSLITELRFVDALRPLSVAAAVAEIVAHLSRRGAERSRGQTPPWLFRVRELLHDECTERMSLERLGSVAGVHPGHVARAFRAHFGLPIAVYSRELRLRRAARALMRSRAHIVEIASDFGFCDQSHFVRLFRQRFGETPSTYRATFGLSKPVVNTDVTMRK